MPQFKSNQTTRRPMPEGQTPILGEVPRKRAAAAIDDRSHVLALHAEHGNDRETSWELGIGGSLTAEQAQALAESGGEAIWWPFGRSGNPLRGAEPQRVRVTAYLGWTAFGYSSRIVRPDDSTVDEMNAHLYPTPAA